MSTTFEVYPGTQEIPPFTEVLKRGEVFLGEFLRARANLEVSPRLAVTVRHEQEERVVPFDKDGPAKWSEGTYAWFTIAGLEGGTDAYFRTVGDGDREAWDEALDDAHFEPWRYAIHDALEIGHYWSFRRSVGQPGIINVAYGLLACALADLTDGLLYSGDGAWEYRRLPAHPDQFRAWYFHPEQTEDPDYAGWAARCIPGLRHDLKTMLQSS